jgi:diamine N-acetyltransferase
MDEAAILQTFAVYFAAFAEHDRARRLSLLQRCMTEDAEIWGPQQIFRGYEGISDKIDGFHARRPGQRLVLASGWHVFENVVRIGVALVDERGAVVARGEGANEFAPDGRIRRALPFWESLPPIPPEWPAEFAVGQLRPAGADAGKAAAGVTLREITADTVVAIVRLSVAESQKGFVATNAVSLAQALFAPPEKPGVGVWRFMIDERFQRRGIGRAALEQVIAHVRAKGMFSSMELSFVPGPGCPEPFYLGLGFRHTGRMDGKEVVLELPLT